MTTPHEVSSRLLAASGARANKTIQAHIPAALDTELAIVAV
jgi:hypothetical protein